MNPKTVRLSLLACCAFVTLATAQQAPPMPVAYPSQGQDAAQQQADKSACLSWAQSNAPSQPVPPTQTGPAVGGGQRAGGALRGAAAGAAIGGVANGDAGHGAAVGATAGVVAGGMRARQQRRQQNAVAAQTQANNATNLNQAYGACMKGKGYSVN